MYFNFYTILLVPRGINTLIFEPRDTRVSFINHIAEGWYVNLALEHYIYYEYIALKFKK